MMIKKEKEIKKRIKKILILETADVLETKGQNRINTSFFENLNNKDNRELKRNTTYNSAYIASGVYRRDN